MIESSPKSAPSVSTVNHHFHKVSNLLKHYRKSLTLNNEDQSLEKLRSLVADPCFLRGLRHLEIQSVVWWKWRSERPSGRPYDVSSEDCPKEEDLTEEATLIIEMVKKAARLATVKITVVPNIKTFTESGERQPWQLPSLFVETLQSSHPKAKLSIFDWQRLHNRVFNLDLAEESLIRSALLKNLSVSDDYDPLKAAGFNFIVRNAQSLESIEIYSFNKYILHDEIHVTSGSEVAGQPQRTERKALLKEIYIHNAETDMRFCDRITALTNLNQLRSLTICGENARITPYFFKQSAPLPHLVHLNLDSFIEEDQSELLTEFLLVLPSLESLTLRICPSPILTRCILSKHGPSLKRLSLGRLQSYQLPATNLQSDCLHIVHELCPDIRVLSGVACEESEPLDVSRHKVLTLLSKLAPRISDGVRVMVPFKGDNPRHSLAADRLKGSNQSFHRAYDIHRLIFPPDVQITGLRILELYCQFERSTAVWSVRPCERDDEPETLEIATECAAVTAQGIDYSRARWRKLVKGNLLEDMYR